MAGADPGQRSVMSTDQAPSAPAQVPARTLQSATHPRPGPIAVILLASGHAALTFIGSLVVFILTLTMCTRAEPNVGMIGGFGALAVLGLGIWAALATRQRRLWLLVAGLVAAAPAVWCLWSTLANPLESCL